MLTKEKILEYLALLSKEIKKQLGRNAQVELVLVGGASILLNYDFRQTTMDIDAMKAQSLNIKDCIFRLSDRLGLPDDWINFDFTKTTSFSPKLAERSTFFRTFNQVLKVYTVKDAPLVCMKLIAFRGNKYDYDDIIGILNKNHDITTEDIDHEMKCLYGNWDRVSTEAIKFLKAMNIDYKHICDDLLNDRENEFEVRSSLINKLESYSKQSNGKTELGDKEFER